MIESSEIKRKSVVFLSHDGLTDPLGQSQILPYMIGMEKKGYSIRIISFEKPNRFENGREGVQKLIHEKSIRWIPLIYHKTPPVISTLWDIWKLWRTVCQQWRLQRFDIIHCRSYITSMIGLNAKREWNVKFIFDMRGFWADERVEGGLWRLENVVYRKIYFFFKRKEREMLSHADCIVSLTQNARNEIQTWSLKMAPVVIIPTCVDLQLFNPTDIVEVDRQAMRAKLGIEQNDFVLLYLGSWGTWYQTRQMMDFFHRLKQKLPKSKFLIVTNDVVDEYDQNIGRDIIVHTSARQQIPLLISISNLSICLIKPSFSKKASSATKNGEVLAMNIPLVANRGWGDIDRLIDAGIVIDYEEPINDIITKSKKVTFGRDYCINELSLEVGLSRYYEIYRNLNL